METKKKKKLKSEKAIKLENKDKVDIKLEKKDKIDIKLEKKEKGEIKMAERKSKKKSKKYSPTRDHIRGIIKGPWTKTEDDILNKLVREKGPKNWNEVADELQGRIGKQCRERWYNHLDPSIRKDPWTQDEDKIIYETHKKNWK